LSRDPDVSPSQATCLFGGTLTHVTMNVVIYVRQSLDREGDGLAVARQESECRKLCEQRGWNVTEVIIDNDTSATDGKLRPGFERLMTMAEGGKLDGIVCWHIDRLTRQPVELERIINVCEPRRVKVVTITGDLDLSTDTGRMVARLVAVFARNEVERKGARQRAANEQRARAGEASKWVHRPFGYTRGRTELVTDEAAAIKAACRLLQTGGALRGIVRDWTKAGFTPPQGAPAWTSQAVRSILINPRIAGLSSYKGEIVGNGTWPSIVDEPTWRAVLAILDNPARRPPQGTQTLLSGLAECACGRVVWAGRSHRGRQVYKCSSYFSGIDVGGQHTSRSAGPVDDFVRDIVVERLSRADAATLLFKAELPDVEALRDRQIVLSNRLDELALMLAYGEINRAQLKTGTEGVRAAMREVESQLADAGRVDVLGDLVNATDVRRMWDSPKMDLDRQRAVVDVLISAVLLPPGRGTRTFRPETVQVTWKAAE
jgi:site-specific DNA recombinase